MPNGKSKYSLNLSRLYARKAELNLTLPQIAERANLSLDTIKKAFYSVDPRTHTTSAIAVALETTPDYLLGFRDTP